MPRAFNNLFVTAAEEGRVLIEGQRRLHFSARESVPVLTIKATAALQRESITGFSQRMPLSGRDA